MNAPRLRYFSHTSIEKWRDCSAAGWVRDVERLRFPQTSEKRLGTLAHAATATHLRAYCATRGIPFKGPTDPREGIREACQKEEWMQLPPPARGQEEDGELALHLAERAIHEMRLHTHRFTPAVHDGLAMIERRVVVPVDDPEISAWFDGGFVAVVDLLAFDAEHRGRLALCDFKFPATLSQGDMALDLQLALYQHALGTIDLWPELAWQYQIVAKPEEPPGLLKKPIKGRRFSTDRGGLVTEASFLAACVEHGEDPDAPHYADFLDFLRKTRRTWACSLGGVDRAMAAAVFEEACTTARQIARLACSPALGPGEVVRNFRSFAGSACRRCNLYNHCVQSRGSYELIERSRRALEEPQPLPTIDLEDLEDIE